MQNSMEPFSSALLTDLYQLTMAYCYWKEALDKKEAVFHLFFRTRPFHGGFAIAAGLESVVNYIKNFHFTESDLTYLRSLFDAKGLRLFPEPFLDYLRELKFTGNIDAVAEGTVVFPFEPLLRIQGPIVECQLLESVLLNLINFPTLIATKAARVRLAAGTDSILEFGLRRSQGIDGALTAARSAYLGGCDATSNVLAGKIWGIPVKGTHGHSWVMVFKDEKDSFSAFAKHMPDNSILLVDTYNSLEGVKKAIEVGKALRDQGHELQGIRLDSGDLAYLSIKSRELLDLAGFTNTQIVASNELDETLISELKRQGARIDVWGVGTNLVTARDQPALDGVYKLSALRSPGEPWEYKLKLSEQMIKVSNPGILQVRRYFSKGQAIADTIYDEEIGAGDPCHLIDPFDTTRQKVLNNVENFHDLLVPIFRQGRCVYTLPELSDIRTATQQQLSLFHAGIKRFVNPHEYVVGMEKGLYDLKISLIRQIRSHNSTEERL